MHRRLRCVAAAIPGLPSRLQQRSSSRLLLLRRPERHWTMAGSTTTLPASLSTHAATGQSASEFLDDAGLLRDQAYVNGKWVDAASKATFAVEGERERWIDRRRDGLLAVADLISKCNAGTAICHHRPRDARDTGAGAGHASGGRAGGRGGGRACVGGLAEQDVQGLCGVVGIA